MMMRTSLVLSLLLAACGNGGSTPPAVDAMPPPMTPDAKQDPPPPPPPKKAYGQACSNGSECLSGLCVGASPSQNKCSRSCSLQVALDCKDVDAFCVPLTQGGNACFGMIESGNDLDDAIVEIGDSVTRPLTPLGDTDVFQVRLNTLGNTNFTATPAAGIDVRIEAYDVDGSPLATQNSGGQGVAEGLSTNVQQIGTWVYVAVTNVGQSTGSFTLSVAHVNTLVTHDDLAPRAAPLHLTAAE